MIVFGTFLYAENIAFNLKNDNRAIWNILNKMADCGNIKENFKYCQDIEEKALEAMSAEPFRL